jgi:hypothetical protein
MDVYHFNMIDSGGQLVQERDTACDDNWQAEAMARMLLLSRGTRAVEAWIGGSLLYRIERP